jgi:alpha-amylase
MDPWFIAEFMRYELMDGAFSVMEWWKLEDQGTEQEMLTYLALTDYRSAFFDMPLRDKLNSLCEKAGSLFDMHDLTVNGLVNFAPDYAVTYVEEHDTIRPYAGTPTDRKWGIEKDKMMAYAFVLLSEGLPLIAYSDYFIGSTYDLDPPDDKLDDGWTGPTLKTEIDALIEIRRKFVAGATDYLHVDGDLLVMARTGSAEKPGCIFTLNDNDTSPKSASVNTAWPQDTILVDVLETNHTVTVQSGGIATLYAPSRGYRVYVNQEDL